VVYIPIVRQGQKWVVLTGVHHVSSSAARASSRGSITCVARPSSLSRY
jgi:hypothetical protein